MERELKLSTSVDTFKGLKKRDTSLENLFAELEFNKKKPKYNYHSGLLAGMLVNDLSILQPILKAGKPEKDLAVKILERVVPKAQGLVKDFNWNMSDLTNLAEQFFGDES